jgi:hypothetical protein
MMMTSFIYNDLAFSLTAAGDGWDITRDAANGGTAQVGTGLFKGQPLDEALTRARALIHAIYPVGIKVVGPDVAHPALVGDLKIVGPNVAHPNFINWNVDSTSFHAD